MKKVKIFLFFFLFVLFFLEILGFAAYKSKLLEISHVPKLYLEKGYLPNDEWWIEDQEWGAWHKKNSSTFQQRSCFNAKYTSNDIGARDSSFKSNSSKDIILLGDSFAEGYGVNYDNTSQKYIEDFTNLNVLNFGVSQNFGPVQYSIIYEKMARNFNHDLILIYFLPNNDFSDNDFSNWRGSKRYRPYYKKIKDNYYNYFIPLNAHKNYMSYTKKLKKVFKDNLWSSNLFINLSYQYKSFRSKKRQNNNFSAYFDTSLDQQKAAIFFIEQIIDSSGKNVVLVSIPRLQDFIRYNSSSSLNTVYWNNYLINKDKLNDKFMFIDLIKHQPKDLNEIYLKCDGHWSPKGNEWAAKIISDFIK
jgi:hypothetical protein|tara:strand:- start:663 stop:1739 length:1077 start_codon:yes stop_codon:yes gene_type:complete